MFKPLSRVAREAREVEKRAQELHRKIKQLSTQIASPQKYFGKKSDRLTQSTVERFYRYFAWNRASLKIKKRKPTRAETRAQRNRAIIWSILASIFIFWVLGKIFEKHR